MQACAQREDDEQIRASQYLLGLRRPDAIEAVAAHDFAVLEQALEHPFFSEEDREAYRRSWRVPRAIESALHWYEVEGIAPPDRDRLLPFDSEQYQPTSSNVTP